MPVHLLNWATDGLLERGVTVRGNELVLADRPAQGELALAGQALAAKFGLTAGYVSEVNLAARAWTRSLADLLDCPARWEAINVKQGGPRFTSGPAALGTAIHAGDDGWFFLTGGA